MKLIIEGEPKEIAALVAATQGRRWSKADLASKLEEILRENADAHKNIQYD